MPYEQKIKVPRFEESAGFYTTEKTAALMRKIKATNSKPEVALRKALWHVGLRYRTHYKKLPGKPDIVFVRWKAVVFVDGDFWHGYDWEKRQHTIKSNRAFWIPKISRNMQRDREVEAALDQLGWRYLRLWSHEIKKDLGASLYRTLCFLENCRGEADPEAAILQDYFTAV